MIQNRLLWIIIETTTKCYNIIKRNLSKLHFVFQFIFVYLPTIYYLYTLCNIALMLLYWLLTPCFQIVICCFPEILSYQRLHWIRAIVQQWWWEQRKVYIVLQKITTINITGKGIDRLQFFQLLPKYPIYIMFFQSFSWFETRFLFPFFFFYLFKFNEKLKTEHWYSGIFMKYTRAKTIINQRSLSISFYGSVGRINRRY